MNLRDIEDFRLSDAVKFHDTLNPALFSDDKMHTNVRDRMLEIAQDFIDHLGVDDIKVKDITLSGSNAAYTYTPHSDIDIHLIVDMDQFSNDEVYRELFNSKKVLYNDNHDIKIHGYDVELYVQDSAQPVRSLGEYSIKNDRWIKFPGKIRAELDQHSVAEKFKKLVQLSQLALTTDNTHSIDNLLQTLKRYRQAGLDEHGEFGPENLAYKALRSQGIIQKLYDQRDRIHSRNLSLDESEDDEYAPPGAPMRDVLRIKNQIAKQQPQKLVTVRGRDIGGSFTDAELQSYGLRKNQATGNWTGTQAQWDRFNRSRGLRETRPLDKPTLTPQQIMRKHGVSYEQLIDQLTQGIKVELEHTTDSEVAYQIALAHLAEDPDYYTKLARVGLEEVGSLREFAPGGFGGGGGDDRSPELYKIARKWYNATTRADRISIKDMLSDNGYGIRDHDNSVIIFKKSGTLMQQWRYDELSEGVAEEVTESRDSLLSWLKQQYPTWPDYVVKDFLYQGAKFITSQEQLADFLEMIKKDFGRVKWRLEKLPITLDIFTPKTQRMIKNRDGGSSNPFQVPKEAERHAQQLKMIQQQGVRTEPIIVAKLSNGYDLIEGWHRTIQHLKTFPEGYTGPAWVGYGATYNSDDKPGVAEGFPQPGELSGKAKQFNPNAKIQTKEMTLDQILSSVKGIPYVNDVIQDWDAKDYSWSVTKKVIEYAQYLQKNPQSVANLPPLVVIDGQLNDGAHRLSAVNLLQKRMDPKNPLWKQVKLKVNFGTSADVTSKQGVAEGSEKIVYHGNQGGINREFITPMWWTSSKEDAVNYATQNGADGWVYSARLSCSNPYVIKPTDETNTVLGKWQELSKQGYDCIYDKVVGDWIPFYAKDIRVIDEPEYVKPEKNGENKNVAEALDKPYKLTWEPGDFGDVDAYAQLPDGSYLSIMFNKGYNKDNEEAWNVEFWRNNSQELTGEGDEFRIFATVLDAIKEFIGNPEYEPNIIIFSASKKVDPGQKEQSRAGLYDSLVQRYARAWGFTVSRIDTGNKVIYEFNRVKKSIKEASGYIPSEKEKNDPRFKTALTVDVKPDSIKRNAQKLGLGRIQRAGIPPTARSDGKI